MWICDTVDKGRQIDKFQQWICDSLTLRVTLNNCYFSIPIHFDHTLCNEKSICSKASETKPNIFVKGGNFGIKSRFGNPQNCRKPVKAVKDVAKVIKDIQSMDVNAIKG